MQRLTWQAWPCALLVLLLVQENALEICSTLQVGLCGLVPVNLKPHFFRGCSKNLATWLTMHLRKFND